MVVFPNGKINIGLQVVEKRTDGFHNIQSIFYPIKIRDIVEIIPSNSDEEITYTQSGLHIDGNTDNNLCIKAYHLLKRDFNNLPHIYMHLHKSIPMGAGLGGGSADGAFTLKLLNDKYNLNLLESQLIKYALELGSDCPFFILNQACYATGRGENLKHINLDLSNYKILIINPGIHVNTGWAFSQLTPHHTDIDLIEAASKPVSVWKNTITNDFEPSVFKMYPAIAELKSHLYEHGALYASMSGSGSSVYGIFDKNFNSEIKIPETYFYKWV
jgi:4-diphosphocytidyl-2-C-methyl-D-erythritol kinase